MIELYQPTPFSFPTGGRFLKAGARPGRPLDTTERMRSRSEAAGFTNIQKQDYKMPLGTWPKHHVYRDARRVTLRCPQMDFLKESS